MTSFQSIHLHPDRANVHLLLIQGGVTQKDTKHPERVLFHHHSQIARVNQSHLASNGIPWVVICQGSQHRKKHSHKHFEDICQTRASGIKHDNLSISFFKDLTRINIIARDSIGRDGLLDCRSRVNFG